MQRDVAGSESEVAVLALWLCETDLFNLSTHPSHEGTMRIYNVVNTGRPMHRTSMHVPTLTVYGTDRRDTATTTQSLEKHLRRNAQDCSHINIQQAFGHNQPGVAVLHAIGSVDSCCRCCWWY